MPPTAYGRDPGKLSHDPPNEAKVLANPSTDPSLNFRLAVSELIRPMRADLATLREKYVELADGQKTTRFELGQTVRVQTEQLDKRLHRAEKSIVDIARSLEAISETLVVLAERPPTLWERIRRWFRRPDPSDD